MAECTQNYKNASAHFSKVKDAEVRKVFKKSADEEAAKGLPELSKKAHQAFKGLTGATSKHDGLGDMATWTTPQATRVAHGHADVGDMVSDYTESVSSKACAPEEFDEPFRARVSGMVQELNQDPTLQGFHGNIAMAHPPSTEEVFNAVKSLRAKMHKSPGIDVIHNWMLVLGGAPALTALQALYARVWDTGDVPEGRGEAMVTYLHKKGSKTEVSNYRPISLLSVIPKTLTKSWVVRLQRVAAPDLVKEQGCGRKGQGALGLGPEPLWDFMAQMEAWFEGDVPDGEDPAGAYALFAYDRVWRDGLYLALYSMGARGPIWRMVSQWGHSLHLLEWGAWDSGQ